nr:MAG TPA: hypothetical protein [Caudoviricetes sp.]
MLFAVVPLLYQLIYLLYIRILYKLIYILLFIFTKLTDFLLIFPPSRAILRLYNYIRR